MSVGAASCGEQPRGRPRQAPAFTDVPPRSTPTTGPGEEFAIVGTIKRLDAARVEALQAVSHVPRGPGRRERRRRRRALRLHRTVRGHVGASARADARGPARARHAAAAESAARAAGRDAHLLRAASGHRAGLLPPAVAPYPRDRDPGRPPALRVLALPRLPGLLRRGRQGEQAHRQADEGGARAGGEHPARPSDQHRHGLGQPREERPLWSAGRLDPARAHRPGQAPHLDALDPARPVRPDPRPRREQDQRRVRVRRAAASRSAP